MQPDEIDRPLDEADTVRLGEATLFWDQLNRHLTDFIAAWEEATSPPSIQDFLPQCAIALKRQALVELIKIDLEYRLRQPESSRRIEDYLADFPWLPEEGLIPPDLIYEEYHLRKSNGDAVAVAEFVERFPDQSTQFQRLVDIKAPTYTGSFAAIGRDDSYRAGDAVDEFELLRELGKGAFGCVFLARQTTMQRLVAVKISKNRGNEPQTLAQLDHPSIVRVYDQREVPGQGARLLYMEYAPGGTLSDVIKSAREQEQADWSGAILAQSVQMSIESGGGYAMPDAGGLQRLARLDWAEIICWVGEQLALALDEAHRRGILHRDVKPANVLLAANGVPKLADFNISFCSEFEGTAPTSYFGGSLSYMSPEHLEAFSPVHERSAEAVDERSDIYSLAVVLWQMLHGKLPFGDEQLEGGWGSTLVAMVERRLAGVQPILKGDGVEAVLERLLVRCLDPHPANRLASARDFARELRLVRDPPTWNLLRREPGRVGRFCQRWPVISTLVAAFIPNALAGVFNYFYNLDAIIKPLQTAEGVFWKTQLVVNLLCFPLGIAVVTWLARPVARRIRHGPCPEYEDEFVIQRALNLGYLIAAVGIIEWSLAGVVYPAALQFASLAVQPGDYAHFFVSLLLCGLIAAAYPFFLMAYVELRFFYPEIVRDTGPTHADLPALRKLSQRLSWFLYLAGGVPSLGMVVLVVTGLVRHNAGTFALLVVSIVGAVGYGLILLVYRLLQRDLAALIGSARSEDDVVV